MNRVSIDLGFLYTKEIIDNHKPLLIKSVVGESKKLTLDDTRIDNDNSQIDRIITRNKNESFFVSDLAIAQSDVIHYSLKPNRFNSVATKVLLDSVLGIGLGSGVHDIRVVSGLPVSHYDRFKSEIAKLFSEQFDYDVMDHGFRYQGRIINMESRFVPQPFGAYMDILLDEHGQFKDKKQAKKTIAIIDIGMGTTDVYVANMLDPIQSLSFSTSTAMNHAYSLILNKIEERFMVNLKLHEIEPIALSKKFKYKGHDYDITELVSWAYNATSRQLVSEIQNKWKDDIWKIDCNYIAGGGGIALSPFILDEFDEISLIDNAQTSIVRGYSKFNRRTWKDVV